MIWGPGSRLLRAPLCDHTQYRPLGGRRHAVHPLLRHGGNLLSKPHWVHDHHHPASFDSTWPILDGRQSHDLRTPKRRRYATGHFGKWHTLRQQRCSSDDYGLDEVKIIGNSSGSSTAMTISSRLPRFHQAPPIRAFYGTSGGISPTTSSRLQIRSSKRSPISSWTNPNSILYGREIRQH